MQRSPFASIAQLIAAPVCVTVPLILWVATVPDTVFSNQVAAVGGWGLWLLLALGTVAAPRVRSARTRAATAPSFALLAGGVLTVMAVASATRGAVSGASAAALVGALAVGCGGLRCTVDAAAGSSATDRHGSNGLEALAWAWWFAGLVCILVASIQYFLPDWATGFPIAASTSPGRAIGNMRQPNHLATALLCAMVMTTWLCSTGRLAWSVAAASMAAMVLGIALSASRGGAWTLAVLVVWAAVDRNLPRRLRWTMAAMPLLYIAFWLAVTAYSEMAGTSFYGLERLQAHGDISSSRLAIWRNTLALIAQNPWTGVGWGNFNFAWTFSPFPDRPVAFFDHSHNALLELAVELGIPAALAIVGLLAWALWQARGALRLTLPATHPGRALFAFLAVLGIHSMLEYPLWYPYFLLPAAWALGAFLGSANTDGRADAAVNEAAPQPARTSVLATWALRACGALMVVGALYALWDHRRVEEIFAPSAGAGSLESRIADGQRSELFGHHADYAAVTNEPKDQRLATFRRPLHQLIDVRLLEAYIEALQADGRTQQALYAAQRLREFRRDDAQAYFAACTPDNPTPPFQCDTRPVPLTWRDMEPPAH